MALYNDPRLHLDNRWQPGACADTSPFPLLWRPRWAAAGRCRVRACVVASAICCAPIAFFSTSLAFSGFLLCLCLCLCASVHRSLSLSSLLPQSQPWPVGAALFAAAGLSPLCRSRATASKTLPTRSALHLDRAGGRAGQRQLASLVRRPGASAVQFPPSLARRSLLMRVASGSPVRAV